MTTTYQDWSEAKFLSLQKEQILIGHFSLGRNWLGSLKGLLIFKVNHLPQWHHTPRNQIILHFLLSNTLKEGTRDSTYHQANKKCINKSQCSTALKPGRILTKLTKLASGSARNQILWLWKWAIKHLAQITMKTTLKLQFHISRRGEIHHRVMDSTTLTINMTKFATKVWNNISTWENLKALELICLWTTFANLLPKLHKNTQFPKTTEVF